MNVDKIVLFGATSFVGQITARYLFQQYGVKRNLSWAIAGRSKQKLEQLKQSLGDGAKDLDLIVADADSEIDLIRLCGPARVIISTVGPYDLYGSKLVKVCAETGTDYLDLTGENLWVKDMIKLHDTKAKASGARIIHGCGFDSIPSDMGVWFLQQHLKKKHGEYADDIQMRVKAMKGGFSGGTVASMVNFFDKAASDKTLFKQLTDPYLLCPNGVKKQPKQKALNEAQFDEYTNSWIAPFVMAPTNEAVVLRSNALNHYAPELVYQEAMSAGNGPQGALMSRLLSGSFKAFMGAMALAPTRNALKKWVLPKPGQGPSIEAQERGYFDLRFLARTRGGKAMSAQVSGNRDPGYGATARMLAEAAICLAHEVSKAEKKGGIWTPASVFDQRLIDRLTQNAGMNFKILETP